MEGWGGGGVGGGGGQQWEKTPKWIAFCLSGVMMMVMTVSVGGPPQFMSHFKLFLNALHSDAAPQWNSLLKLIMKACLHSKMSLFVVFAWEGVSPPSLKWQQPLLPMYMQIETHPAPVLCPPCRWIRLRVYKGRVQDGVLCSLSFREPRCTRVLQLNTLQFI